jgi:hypothetical protein
MATSKTEQEDDENENHSANDGDGHDIGGSDRPKRLPEWQLAISCIR